MSNLSELNSLLAADAVLLCGVSGSGKTRLAKKLERAGFHRISIDGLVDLRYGHEFDNMSPELRKAAYNEAHSAAAAELERLLSEGRKVVIDGSMCKRAKRDMMREVCRRCGVEALTVFLDATFETLSGRLSGRRDSGPDDRTVSTRELKTFLANFERPTPDEHTLIMLQQ